MKTTSGGILENHGKPRNWNWSFCWGQAAAMVFQIPWFGRWKRQILISPCHHTSRWKRLEQCTTLTTGSINSQAENRSAENLGLQISSNSIHLYTLLYIIMSSNYIIYPYMICVFLQFISVHIRVSQMQ